MNILNTGLASLALTTITAMTISTSINAQVDRRKAPAPAPAPEVKLGDHATYVLDNGMRVIVVENNKLPMVTLQLKIDIEPVLQSDKVGYIDLVGEMLGAGTARKRKSQIDELVDGAGATLYTSPDGLSLSVLKKNLKPMMELAFEMMTASSFPPVEFDKAKTRALSALKSRQDDPDGIADEVSNALTYRKGHPYGEVVTEESLQVVGRKHCYAYYQRFFRPENAYLVLVGDISEKEAKEYTSRLFSSWKGQAYTGSTDERGDEIVDGLGVVRRVTKTPKPQRVRRMAIVDRPGAPQSVIRVLFPVDLKPGSPDAASVSVMSNILGGGVFNARLMQNLREDKAFTYGARSSIRPDKRIGRFIASASVRTEVTDSAVTEFLFEIERMRQSDVTEEELEVAKNFLAGSFARSLEDPQTIARFALNGYLNDLPKDHYSGYLKRLEAVTIADVRRTAEKYLLPDNAVVLIVGSKDEVGNKLVPLSLERQLVQYDMNGDVYREVAKPAPVGLTAQQVVDNYLEAIGGKAKLQAIDDVSQKLSANINGKRLVMNVWKEQPGKYATETELEGQLVGKVVFDGTEGYRLNAEGAADVIDLDIEEILLESKIFPELHYSAKVTGARLLLAGMTEVQGKEAYKVSIATANGNRMTDLYDVKTGLKLRRTESQRKPEGNINVVTDYKDYREVDGVLFPHLIQQNSMTDLSFVLEEIKVNKGIDQARFYAN